MLDVFKESGIYRTIGGRNNSYTDEGFKEFLAENAQSEANSELLRWRIQIESELVLRTENPCANISVYFPDCTSPEYST